MSDKDMRSFVTHGDSEAFKKVGYNIHVLVEHIIEHAHHDYYIWKMPGFTAGGLHQFPHAVGQITQSGTLFNQWVEFCEGLLLVILERFPEPLCCVFIFFTVF